MAGNGRKPNQCGRRPLWLLRVTIRWGCSSAGRAAGSQSAGRGFESRHLHHSHAPRRRYPGLFIEVTPPVCSSPYDRAYPEPAIIPQWVAQYGHTRRGASDAPALRARFNRLLNGAATRSTAEEGAERRPRNTECSRLWNTRGPNGGTTGPRAPKNPPRPHLVPGYPGARPPQPGRK